MLTSSELHAEMQRIVAQLDQAHSELVRYTRMAANSDSQYKIEWSKAFLRSPAKTEKMRAAEADLETAEQRRQRHLDEGMKVSALEAVRSKRGQLSALQTISNAMREEAALGRTAPAGAGY